MRVRPATGDQVAFCLSLMPHTCSYPYDKCRWDYGTVGDYKSTWTSNSVPIKTLRGQWTATTEDRVWPAMFTFFGPIRRTWDWRFA